MGCAVSAVNPEALAVRLFGEYMLANLPARVTAINAARAVTLKSAYMGPFTIPVGGVINIGITRDDTAIGVGLTNGSRTAAQIATEVNNALILGGNTTVVASADSDGRLVLTGAAPTSSVVSGVSVRPAGLDVDTNEVFGWSLGGEYAVAAAIVTPSLRHFRDGWGERMPDGDGGRFYLIVRDEKTTLIQANKHARNEYEVQFPVMILCPEPTGAEVRNRDRIRACVQAVREVLSPAVGRMLGRGANGDVMICQLIQSGIAESPFRFTGSDKRALGPLFDAAEIVIGLRVHLANL